MDFDDYMPIIAAAVGGHGRADWGNWAKRQLRDQNGDDAGEWIEMGRGSRFRYQKSDGSIGTGTATYVGFSDKPNHGKFYVKGVDGVKDGVYDLDAGSVDPVKFYFAEGTKVGDYLENYYKSIGRNLDDIDANSKLPVIDFSALTPSELTEEEANEIKTENRMPPPRNLDEQLKSRTEGAKTASELQEGDIVFDEALNRYGSVELVEPSPDNSGNVDAVVRWSNNQVQELTNLPADQEVKVWPQEKEQQEAAPAPTTTQEEPAAEPAQELKDEISGDEALQTIRSAVAKDLEEQGRFPLIRDSKDIENTVSKQYKSLFEQIKRENPELLKGIYNYRNENGEVQINQDIETPEQFWDHVRKYGTDLTTQWIDPENLSDFIKKVNTLYAEKFLGIKPDGFITFYRNNIRRTDSEANAAAGYASLDKYMAFDYNVERGLQDGGPNVGRYEIKVRPDEVTGLLGFSQIADEIGVAISNKVTAIPGRVKRLGDVEIPNPDNAPWFDLANLKDGDYNYNRSTGSSPFRQLTPLGQFDYYALDSSPFGEGDSWSSFYEANGLQKGAVPSKYDELYGEGSWEKDWGSESPRAAVYKSFFKEFKDKDGTTKWGLAAEWLHELAGAGKYFTDPKEGDEYDRAIKVLSVMQELTGKKFFAPRGQKEELSPVDAKKAKPATKKVEDIEVGDRVIRNGKAYTISGVKKLQAGSQFMAKPDDGGPVEKFSLKDEDKLELAPAVQAEQPVEEAPATPATQAPVVEQAKTKTPAELKKGDQIQAGGETYTVVSVAKAKGDTGEVSVTVTSESTGDAQIKLKFDSNEAIDLVQPKAPAAEAEPVDLEKQKYEDALANGADRNWASLKYGNVIYNSKGAEFIFISAKQGKDKNDKSVGILTLQAPDGSIIESPVDLERLLKTKVEPETKKNAKPFSLKNSVKQPNVPDPSAAPKDETQTEPVGETEVTTGEPGENQKRFDELEAGDRILYGKNKVPHTYKGARAVQGSDGEVLGFQPILVNEASGDEFLGDVFAEDDVINMATGAAAPKAAAKPKGERKLPDPPSSGTPGTSGRLNRSQTVSYEVLPSGRVILLGKHKGLSKNSETYLQIQRALANMPKTLGKFSLYYYDGTGVKKRSDGSDPVPFPDATETRQGWVLELNTGEKDQPKFLVEKMLKQLYEEINKDKPVQEEASEEKGFTGEEGTAGKLSDSPSVRFEIKNGVITLSGNVPGGLDELRDHLFEKYPDQNVVLDPDMGEIEVFPGDEEDEDELRSDVLSAIKKFVGGEPVEKPKQEEPKQEEPKEEEVVEDATQKTYDVIQAAYDFYLKQISSDAKAAEYLKGRGFDKDSVDGIGVGFAPGGKAALYNHLTSLGFTREEMIGAGLVAEGDDGAPFDRFRNRVVFPFKDSEGRVTGFNARDVTGKADIKYLLSSGPNADDPKNRSVFKKGETLFNLDNAKDAVKEKGQLIIVEGPMDVLAYRAAGINNVIAGSGVALSPEQIDLIKNTFGDDLKEVILSFDSDEPGKKATQKAYEALADSGYDVSTVTIKESKDPGEVFEKQGADGLKLILNERRDASIKEEDLSTTEQFTKYFELLFKYKDKLSESDYEQWYEAFDNDTTKDAADKLIENLVEKFELADIKKELDEVFKKAVEVGAVLELEKLKLDFKITSSKDKKQTIQDAIDSLKKKIEAKKPAVVKAEITPAQRESINRRLSLGVVTQEQRDALVAILEKPDLTKDEIEKVIRTLDLAENIWRINNGWTLDDRRGIVMTPPIIDLGVTPMQVVQRIKTYKPTKDINGNPLPQQPTAEEKKPAAKAPDAPTPTPKPEFFDPANTVLTPEKNNNAYWQWAENSVKNGTISPEDLNELKDRIKNAAITSRTSAQGTDVEGNRTRFNILKSNVSNYIKNNPNATLEDVLSYLDEDVSLDKDLLKWSKLLEDSNLREEIASQVDDLIKQYYNEAKSTPATKSDVATTPLNDLRNKISGLLKNKPNEKYTEEEVSQIVEDFIQEIVNNNLVEPDALNEIAFQIARVMGDNYQTGGRYIYKNSLDGIANMVAKKLKEKPKATPSVAPVAPTAEPAKAGPSNLGKKTGTTSLPQTMDNFNADGSPAYAPNNGAFRGDKLKAQIKLAYQRGGWAGVQKFLENSNVVSFDTETTGMEGYDGQLRPGNRLIQLGASKKDENGKEVFFNVYIRQEDGVVMTSWSAENLRRPVLDENGEPTGEYIKLEKEWLDQQKDEKQVLEDFIKFLGEDVVLLAHNANFDISVLEEALDRHGLSINALGAIDTLDFVNLSLPKYNPDSSKPKPVELDAPKRKRDDMKSEDVDPNNPMHFKPSGRLEDVLKYFGLEATGWHRADADAYDASRILDSILDWLIKNPERESTNGIGHGALDFDQIASTADRQLGKYLQAIGSGTPATDKQKSLNPKTSRGRKAEGFAPDLRELGVSEDEVKKIIAPVQGMTRGQAAEYIASILSDVRSGKEADINTALSKAGAKVVTPKPSNAIPNAAPQDSGPREFEVSKRAKDLSVGDKIRVGGTDEYGIIKSVDTQTAGLVRLTVAYEDGRTDNITIKPNKEVAVFEPEDPAEAVINDSAEVTETAAPVATETPDEKPADSPAPTPTEGEPTKEEEDIVNADPQQTIDLSNYPAENREGIKEFYEILNDLNALEGKNDQVKIIESGKVPGLVEDYPPFIKRTDTKDEIYRTLTDLGMSKFKAKRLASKLEAMSGKPGYLAELKKVNEDLRKEQKNKQSFKNLEKVIDFGEFLRRRGTPEGYDLYLSEDPRDIAKLARERALYKAWEKSLKNRKPIKTITDGNVSVSFSADEAEHAERLLEATKKIQDALPIDGRKLKVSVYSPEQLALLELGDLVGASIVTDKLAHIAVSSNIVGKKESDSREGSNDPQIDSDTFVIAHEYGHVFDEVAMGGQSREDFAKQFGNKPLTEYGTENLSENFAEYIMDLAYSALKGKEPVSKDFKDFIDKAVEDGRIDAKRLKKGGPFFSHDAVKPRRIVAKVNKQEIPDLLEKTEEELKQFENATNVGNGTRGAWLKGSDAEAGYIPDLANDAVAIKYAPQILGASEDQINALSKEDKQRALDDIRDILGPVAAAQRQDSRRYRVFEVAGTNIHIRAKDGSVTPETLSSLVNELKELNRFNDMGGMPVIVTLADSGTFTLQREFLDSRTQGLNLLNGDNTQMHVVLATNRTGDGTYNRNPDDKYDGPAPKTEILNTLIHEYLGHGIAKVFLGQHANGLNKHHERFKDFEAKFPLTKSSHPVSVYGNDSTGESFAEFVRAGYLLMRNGQTTKDYPEIKRFLQYLDPKLTTLDPIHKTNKVGSDLSAIDRSVSASPVFPQPKRFYNENAVIDTYTSRSAFYSNGLDPYGRPVDPEFDETLFLAYTMAQGARSLYMKNPGPSSDNFIRYAAYASVVNDLYDAKFFSYPKNNPRQTVDTVLENISTPDVPGSFRRWQSDKPFIPLRYASKEAKFNNDFVAGTYTDASGNTYQIAYISSKPADSFDDISESAQVFISKPNQTLGDFVDFDSTLNDLIKNSAGQLKIRNHKMDGMLERAELEIQGTMVKGTYRRMGLATAMLAFAKQNSPKYLRFGKEQTVQEDAWARSVDQNPKNHRGLPAFTNSESGLNPSNVSPIADLGLRTGQSTQSPVEPERINFNPDNRNAIEEDSFNSAAAEFLANPAFSGSKDYSSSDGGGLGETRTVVGAVSVETLSSIAGNEVDETRVQELIEKIKTGKGFPDPVIVYYSPLTGESVVADGNHHVEAAKRLEISHVPTRVITGEFNSSEFMAPKKVGKEWDKSPFKNKNWPMHVNPYFVFNNADLVSYLEDASPVDPMRDLIAVRAGSGEMSPDMDDISKLMGRVVKDKVTGQIYQVYDEYYDEDGTPTGKIVVRRFAGLYDVLGGVRENERVNGRFTFDSNGVMRVIKGRESLNSEDPYNDIKQYEIELRNVDDVEDVTESFVKSGAQSFVVAESMFYAWAGNDKKGRINKFVSPGVVELAVLKGIDADGEPQYDLYEVPVTELLPIQNQRETLNSEPALHSQDMRPNPTTVIKIMSLIDGLRNKGYMSDEFYNSIATALKGGFQTASGVEDMYDSLQKLSERRTRQLKESGELERRAKETTARAQQGPAEEPAEAPATPTPTPTPAIVKGRMSFRQLFEENKKDKDGSAVDRKLEGPTPIPESQNPLGKPKADDVREVIEILAEIADAEGSSMTSQGAEIILESLRMATPGMVSDYLQSLRAKRILKRQNNNQPISDINLPEGLSPKEIEKLKNYRPEFNLDGTAYDGNKPAETVELDPEVTEIIDFITYNLLPGSAFVLTGGAGTGKTYIIKKLYDQLKNKKNKNIAIVSPTGAAARNVGDGIASTIHSYFGFDPKTLLAEGFDTKFDTGEVDEKGEPIFEDIATIDDYIEKLPKTKKGKALAALEYLVIDEISMVNANLLDSIDLALRSAKRSQEPFGGVKVVLVGDDNQLPPVQDSGERELTKAYKEYEEGKISRNSLDARILSAANKKKKHEYMLSEYRSYKWYDSNVLNTTLPLHYKLTKNKRQASDKEFADILNRGAVAQITEKDLETLNSRRISPNNQPPKDQAVIRLVLTNDRAAVINDKEIKNLKDSGAQGQEFTGSFSGAGSTAFEPADLHAPQKITYYIGEKVMFTVNDDTKLKKQGGYTGKDSRWSNGTQGVVVGFDENDGLPIVEITSENGSKNKVKVGYATSTATGADVKNQIDEIAGTPVSRVGLATLAEYTQIPMIPAYAITIHKAQGITLDTAILDLLNADGKKADVRAAGQVYVGLSRIKTLNGLYLTRKLDYEDFIVDDRNSEYYKEVNEVTLEDEAAKSQASSQSAVDKKVDSGDKILLSDVTKADVKEAKKILEHKTKAVSGLSSDWGTRDLSDHFFSEFGYGEESSFKQNLNAIMSEKLENLHLEQKLLVSLIVAHGRADIYEHAESGTIIKRHREDGIFSNKDASDIDVVRAANAHKLILDSGYVIEGGRMDINLRDLSYIKKNASGMYSASKDEINLDRNETYGWAIQGKKNQMSQDDQLAYVLAHEYGHALDNKFAENGTRLSEVLENLIKSGMQNRAKEILRGYALSSPPEYFAESYAGLILQSVLNQLGYSDKAAMDEDLIDEIKNRINLRNSQ